LEALWLFRPLRAVGGILLVCLLAPLPVRAQEDSIEGLFVTVRSPITSDVAYGVKEIANRAILKFKSGDAEIARRSLVIVFDFSPSSNGPSDNPDFGGCYTLAEYIHALQGADTVAFLHGEVTGHTVLPVLACQQVVMSSEAKIGRVFADPEVGKSDVKIGAYLEVTKDRRSPAVVRKMLDPDLIVLRAKNLKDGSEWFIDKSRKIEEEKKGFMVLDETPVVDRGAQSTLFTANQARELGLCQRIKESRQELAAAFGLPPTSLREDSLLGRAPLAWRIDISGVMTQSAASTAERRIRRAIGHKANLIILQITCAGGDTQVARDFAEFLRGLAKEDPPVMTVAYIPDKAPDTATFIALGCNAIVMNKNAELGDFSSVVQERRANDGPLVEASPAKYQGTRDSLKGLAEAQGYSVLVAEGMLNRDLVLYEVVPRKGPRKWQLIAEAELKADKQRNDPQWMNERLVKAGGKFLTLNADQAKELELAQNVVDGLPAVYEIYGVDAAKVRTNGPDWLEQLADFLTHPLTRFFLVMIGIVCLILELKLPGVGLPGVIAAVCFILFFWAHSQLAGQFTILAILLFILGLILIGLEIFVLPGSAVAGISGTILVVASLALVTLEKWPETRTEWIDIGWTFATFGGSLLLAVVAAMTLAWYLPHIPYLNRLVMKSAATSDEYEDGPSPELIDPRFADLLGAIGVAATPLRPAGKMKFGEEYLDVVAEGSFVQPGSRVQIVVIEGNRIVVKEV
jgi:membrane-bound ClpP family serine protease